MVMNFFSSVSPKGKKKDAVMIGDEESLDSVSLNDGKSPSSGTRKSNHDSTSGGSYHNSIKSDRSFNVQDNGGIDAKLLKEERQLRKTIAMSKDKPVDKKVQKARVAILKEKVKVVTVVEQDLINRCLGVDEDGYCLRHQDQKVRMGIVQPMHRFETISICQSCAFGAASGIEYSNHGQKDKTISHAVNGALVATGVKKKKKKIKGAFAANMNGSASNLGENHVSTATEEAGGRGNIAFTSMDALQSPSMAEHQNEVPNSVSQNSRGNLEKDSRWMEEVQVRVLQVNSWDNATAPLKCHPNYAKYFRMLNSGIPVEEIKQINGEEDCPDLLALSLDPEKSLKDQMNSLPHHIQDRLNSNEALMTSNSVKDDESKTVELIYHSYLTQLHVFEQFLQEDEAGIKTMRQSFETAGSMASDISPMTNPDGTPVKKKKKLRLTKKIKRLVGASPAHRELTTDDEPSEEEFSESHTSLHHEDNPVAARPGGLAVGPVPLQPLPQAGLRRARRPNAATKRGRKPAAAATPDRGVIRADNKESPVSPLTPASERKKGRRSFDSDPGRSLDSGERKSLDSEIMDSIMSTPTAEDVVEKAQQQQRRPPPPKESKPDVVAAPSDEAEEGLATPATEKSTPAAPMVIKSFPSRASTEELKPPVMVLKSFPSTNKDEEKKPTGVPMVIKSFPSGGKKALNFSSKKKEKEPEEPTPDAKEEQEEAEEESQEEEDEMDEEEEKRKREELRKAVEAMHQFKLGSYDDSFGSVPTTVLPDLHPETGEPSIHTHLSSISSHSSDATSSDESESDSDSDSDDDDDEDENDHSSNTEHEKVDMDDYIHLQDKLIDMNAELFEAKYLLENSQKREEALIEANKAKDRKIVDLTEAIQEMQLHINTLAAQNAEAGKIMMELTATIEANKRQQLFRRISIASGMSAGSDPWEEDLPGSRPGSQHQRLPAHTRRASGSQHSQRTSSYHRRLSNSLQRRLSGSHHSSSLTKGEADEIAAATPMMIAVSRAASASDILEEENSQEVPKTSNVRQVSAPSNIRQVSASRANVRQVSASSNIRQVSAPERKSSEPENKFPHAANVREIAPNDRRRVKSISSHDGKEEIASTPIEQPKPPTRKKSHEVVIRSFQPSAKLEERRRRKRELEERLKISVARSVDDNELHFTRTSITAGGDEEEV